MGCGASINAVQSSQKKEGGLKKGSKKTAEKAPEIVIGEDYSDPVFHTNSVVLWGHICKFLPLDLVIALSELDKGFNSSCIFRTFTRLKLNNDLHKEEAKDYLRWVQSRFSNAEEIDAHGFKYKKLANFLLFKMKSVKKVTWRMNTALLVKILPQTPNITKIETTLKGMTQYAELMKFPHLTELTLLEIDESTPVQKLLMQCPNLIFLELCTGWARNYPTLTHHKVEIVKARHTGDGSQHIDFKSKMANYLDDYLPNLKELYNVSGNNIIKCQPLEVFSCSYYRKLEDTIQKSPNIRKLIAYSSSFEPENCEPDNLEDVDFNKVKISNLPLFFEKTPKLRKAKIRNIRLEEYPLDKDKFMSSPLLTKLHLEVEHSYPPEDLHLLIKGFPKLQDFTVRYIPKKKLTYDEVLRIMEVKKIVLDHIENSDLGRFTLIEGYHKDYPIYYEFAMKETFQNCKSLKTIVLITLPTKKRQGLVKHYFDRFQYEEKETVWVCDRKVFEDRPEKKLKKAAKSKEKAKEAELAKKKQEQKTMEEKMHEMEENKDVIEESQILAKAEVILKKKETDINEYDEEILAQADDIMRKRKENMQKIHMRMKKKRERARSVIHHDRGRVPKISLLAKALGGKRISKDDHDQDDVKLRLRSKFNAKNMWGDMSKTVKTKVKPNEEKKSEKTELNMSFFASTSSNGQEPGIDMEDNLNIICETPLMSPAASTENLLGNPPKSSSEGNSHLFDDILGELSGKETSPTSDILGELNRKESEVDEEMDFQDIPVVNVERATFVEGDGKIPEDIPKEKDHEGRFAEEKVLDDTPKEQEDLEKGTTEGKDEVFENNDYQFSENNEFGDIIGGSTIDDQEKERDNAPLNEPNFDLENSNSEEKVESDKQKERDEIFDNLLNDEEVKEMIPQDEIMIKVPEVSSTEVEMRDEDTPVDLSVDEVLMDKPDETVKEADIGMVGTSEGMPMRDYTRKSVFENLNQLENTFESVMDGKPNPEEFDDIVLPDEVSIKPTKSNIETLMTGEMFGGEGDMDFDLNDLENDLAGFDDFDI